MALYYKPNGRGDSLMDGEGKRKRGRPALSPEEKTERAAKRAEQSAAIHKANGYAAQKKYQKEHPEKRRIYRKTQEAKTYSAKIRIPVEMKDELFRILKRENLSLTQMFVTLVREKYGVDLKPDSESAPEN